MATIKVKFRPSAVAGHEGSVYYQVIHKRRVRQVSSACHVFPAEWDGRRSTVAVPHPEDRRVQAVLAAGERIRWDVEQLERISRELEAGGGDYTADDVVAAFCRHVAEHSLFGFMGRIIVRLKRNGKVRTSETYTAALHSFRKFRRDEDIMLDGLTSSVMEAYEAWLHGRGIAPNTVSFYTRILRAVYNRAVGDGITEDRHPFRHVYTGVDKTRKRALPLPVVRKINALDLAATPPLDYARDMFMMSFMLRGMSLIDMAFLRKTDLANGRVTYRRRKTGQLLTIEWTKEMQRILDKYPENTSPYLLPIIRHRVTNERCVYRNVGYNINHNLKKIAGKVGISIPLTLYVARHSWASAAKAKGIPISVISEGMGHNSETTTLIYLASLDASVVDKANSLILKCL